MRLLRQAYGVKDDVEAANVPFLDDYRGHPSIRTRAAECNEIITF